MLEESEDPVVEKANEKLITRRKWKVDKEVEDAKGSPKFKEIYIPKTS